jgi:hypothetical protein
MRLEARRQGQSSLMIDKINRSKEKLESRVHDSDTPQVIHATSRLQLLVGLRAHQRLCALASAVYLTSVDGQKQDDAQIACSNALSSV